MPSGISEDVQQFIFEHVDAIEQLDVLLLLRQHATRTWTAKQIADELRSNGDSIAKRLTGLRSLGLIEDDGATPPAYRYQPRTPEVAKIVDDLAEACRVRKHQVYALIFSTLKRARKFLNAFTVERKEDRDE